MTERPVSEQGQEITLPTDGRPRVIRTDVTPGLQYSEYRRELRRDFLYSCAYCGMSEAEAQAIRMTIDHYEPRKARPDLINSYNNLMYVCEECNLRKGDRCPPDSARVQGYRFFRPDEDLWQTHFGANGLRLEAKSNTGYYSLAALDLNRASLRRLRDIRSRLMDCAILASEGVRGLRHMRIDQLPVTIRGKAARAVSDATKAEEKIAADVDAILADYARSPLLEGEDEVISVNEARRDQLKSLENLFPGSWRPERKSGAKTK